MIVLHAWNDRGQENDGQENKRSFFIDGMTDLLRFPQSSIPNGPRYCIAMHQSPQSRDDYDDAAPWFPPDFGSILADRPAIVPHQEY
jgi:hypothetical protein